MQSCPTERQSRKQGGGRIDNPPDPGGTPKNLPHNSSRGAKNVMDSSTEPQASGGCQVVAVADDCGGGHKHEEARRQPGLRAAAGAFPLAQADAPQVLKMMMLAISRVQQENL